MENHPVTENTPKSFPTGKTELLFAGLILICGWLICNSVFYGGLYLGFALFSGLALILSTLYLLRSGCKLTGYTGALLGLSLVLTAAFARSDDAFVKFVMACFLLVSSNLGLCLLANQNRRDSRGFLSIFDAPRTMFTLGCGKLAKALDGIFDVFRQGGSVVKRSGAIGLGLVIAVPVLAILIPLLVGADAAFEAVLDLLPEIEFGEILTSVLTGSILAWWLYTRGTALRHAPKAQPKAAANRGLSAATVNTVLIAVSIVYVAYLLSQLAYFSGGLSGILPDGYTLSEYARRGFFEMAWICAVNLTVIAFSVGLLQKDGNAPLLTRILCLFIAIITLFLVVAASAKMYLYINSYGLTRLRVLTEIIMVFLGISTALVTVWLFVPKLPYMKAIVLTAMILCTLTAWADVDTVVAKYNVEAYQSGKLATVDTDYLGSLGDGAIPYLYTLTSDSDPDVAYAAKQSMRYTHVYLCYDFRNWNIASALAEQYTEKP